MATAESPNHESIGALTDREKETLRLLLRGHDAKSSARELDLSVHTINERLRAARRKLDVTSSKEAARLLLAAEGERPELLGNKVLGDAPPAPDGQLRGTRHKFAWAIGAITMLTLAFALVLSTAPSTAPDHPLSVDVENVERAAAIQQTARTFLERVDEKDWNGSFAMTSDQFQSVNTVQDWANASRLVYGPLGALQERGEATVRFVNAPPAGYQEVTFASRYAKRGAVQEIITLVNEDGRWKVAGILVD